MDLWFYQTIRAITALIKYIDGIGLNIIEDEEILMPEKSHLL